MATKKSLDRIKSTRNQRVFAKLIKRFPNRLNIVAEGDSWFAYPRKWLVLGRRSNVIDYLKYKKRFNLLELASNGDEAVEMLAGKKKSDLIKVIEKYPLHFLLFSGGGNDIVGLYDFDFILKDKVKSNDWKDYLDLKRLNRRLKQIENAYQDLIDYCRVYSKNPGIRLVTHCYDYAIPNEKGAEFAGGLIRTGPWMYPYLKEKKVPKRFYSKIARYLIDRLAEILLSLEKANKNKLLVADTRGTIKKKEWLNEIHPAPKGFKKITDVIFEKMKPYFRLNKVKDFSSFWDQDRIPVIFLQGEKGPLVIKLPQSPDNKTWLKSGRRNNPKWLEDYGGWQVPKRWFQDVTKQALEKFGKAYVIQPHYPKKICAPACWNAKGIECVCSCEGENHGYGQPPGRWYIVSNTYAFQYVGKRYSCRLILQPECCPGGHES